MDDLVRSWVERSEPAQSEFRQAVHIILMAFSSQQDLQRMAVMKGGILLAIRYGSSRFTKDIDFSSPGKNGEVDLSALRINLEAALVMAVEEAGYGLDCRVQAFRLRPDRADATFPAVEIKIGHAPIGTKKHLTLLRSNCTDVVAIDISLNETILVREEIPVDGAFIQAYGRSDLMAEKYRALLQQEARNRFRRQDVYDLNMLAKLPVTPAEQALILKALLEKSSARDIVATPESLDNPEIRRRAESDYATLADEIDGLLPDFGEAYACINSFYKSLPW